eukprot:gene6408-7138_t
MSQERVDSQLLLEPIVEDRNVPSESGAEQLENMKTLKRRRGHAKGELTKAINHVVAELTIGGDICEISVKESRMSKAFEEFQRLCDEYSKFLKDEEDMEECLVYFQEGERRFSEVKERITLWCQSRVQSRSEEQHPVESASQVNSEYSRYSSSKQSSRSRRSSKMATESRRLNNRAQLASLQAEVSFLHQHELIASEELRLNRMKEKLKLETQMAKISAEEKVFTDFETRSQISTEDKPFNVPHVSTSIPPLKKTDESIARPLESVVAKYEAEPSTRVNPQTDAIQDFQMNPHASPWERSPQPDSSLKKNNSAVSVADVEYLQSMKKYVTEPKKMPSRAANFSVGAQETSNLRVCDSNEENRLTRSFILSGLYRFKTRLPYKPDFPAHLYASLIPPLLNLLLSS